jgi:hypothetical protein
MKGTQKQRFVALTVISVNKPSYLESLSSELNSRSLPTTFQPKKLFG